MLEAEERAVKVMRGGEEKGRWGVKGERRLGARDRDRFRAREMGATLGFSRRGTYACLKFRIMLFRR